jgi:hypothetical protein
MLDPLANVDQGVPMNTRLVNDFDAETQAAAVKIDKYGCISYNHLSNGELFNLNYHISQEIFKGSIQISAEKAMKLNPEETRAALTKEIEGMVKKMVWKGVHRKKLPYSVKNQIIRSSAFIKIKKDQITKQQNCYQDLLPLLASCAGIYTALQARLLQNVFSNPGDGLVIECKHLDMRVVLPLHGPIEAAIQNVKPTAFLEVDIPFST